MVLKDSEWFLDYVPNFERMKLPPGLLRHMLPKLDVFLGQVMSSRLCAMVVLGSVKNLKVPQRMVGGGGSYEGPWYMIIHSIFAQVGPGKVAAHWSSDDENPTSCHGFGRWSLFHPDVRGTKPMQSCSSKEDPALALFWPYMCCFPIVKQTWLSSKP